MMLKVIPAGFEPTTRSLEGCCSIQLSYETNIQVCFATCGGKGRHFPLKSEQWHPLLGISKRNHQQDKKHGYGIKDKGALMF